MNDEKLMGLLTELINAQDKLNNAPRYKGQDIITRLTTSRDGVRSDILSEFAKLRQQRDELAEACQYFVDGWRMVPTDKMDMAYSLADAALASIEEQ